MTQIEFKKLKTRVKCHSDCNEGDIIAILDELSSKVVLGTIVSHKTVREVWTFKRKIEDIDLKDNRIWAIWEDIEDNKPRQVIADEQTIKLLTPTEKILYGASK